MHITSREREIINLLLLSPDGITVSEIAKKLNLSQRTIHRELKGITTILTDHQLILEKKSGIGLLLQGTNEKRNELKISLLKQTTDFTAKEREELILLTLLKRTDPIKLIALANDFNVTVGTISTDLDQVATYLATFAITLVRKRGHGISLKATEQQKRNALGYFLAMQFNEYEFLEILKDPIPNENRFLEIIKIEKLTLADKLIREMMEQYELNLTDHAHMTLTIHLSLTIQRVVQGEIITIDKELLAELKNDDKYGISKEIAIVFEDVFNIEIPDAELGYITIHLKGARLNATMMNRTGEHNSIHTLACKSLILYVSQKLNVPFEKDFTILEGLLKHIEPAVYRIERNLDLYNPLTTKIIKEYPRLFAAVKEGLENCFSHLEFTDGEVAYVVLYFGASSVLYDAKKEIKLAVICPSGLGSSKMLEHRIKEEIEGVEVTALSLGDFKMPDLLDFDLVLSTVNLTEYSGKYLLVSPILNDLEIDLIQKEIRQYTGTTEDILLKRVHQKNQQKEFRFDINAEFLQIKAYSELVLKLLDEFAINYLSVNEQLDKVVSEMLKVMYTRKMITDIAGVQVDLKKREMLGGFGIPGTELAFYHCRSAHVISPVFSMFRLDSPITIKAMDKTKVDVTCILVMLASTETSVIEHEILSSISGAVVENESATRLFTVGACEEIKERLSSIFYEKFKMILK